MWKNFLFHSFSRNSLISGAVIAEDSENTFVHISHSGSLQMHANLVHATYCVFNLINFPYDEQNCPIITMGQNGGKGRYKLNPTAVVHQSARDDAEWDVQEISAYSAYGEDSLMLPAAIISIHMARFPSFYVKSIVVPMILLGLIGLGSFMIPLKGGERASICVSVVLGMTIFQVVLSDALPRTSRPGSVPIMFSYTSKSFIILVALTITSFFNIRLSSRSGHIRWRFARFFFFRVLAVMVLLGKEGLRKMKKSSSTK